ncbi:MAG: response regulator, partial [Myxococcales bacterium]|nr:response regulator [Myxococcales bacterium]
APPSAATAVLEGRVLVVDDDQINRLVATRLLGKMGLQVDVVGSGAEALERLAQAPFDAVLMDCQMPDMDGYETTRALRQRETEGRVRVVAMTASAMEEDRRRCYEAGMDAFISKPVRRESLVEVFLSLGMVPVGDAPRS